MEPKAIVKAIGDLRELYNEFTPETEVWKQDGHRRSPYRALIVMGLAFSEEEGKGLEVSRQLIELYPTANLLKGEWINDRYFITSTAEQLGQTKHNIDIIEAAVMLGDNIPSDTKKLQRHPGIGPVVAEKVVAYGFGKPALPVDIDAKRVVERISGSDFNNDEMVRDYLEELFPLTEWIDIHELLSLHGQVLCYKVPECKYCPITTCSERKLSYIGSMEIARENAKLVIEEWENWRRLLLNSPN
jgi:endonuclease-3